MLVRTLLSISILSALVACGGGSSSSGGGTSGTGGSGGSGSTVKGLTDDALSSDQWYLDNTGTTPSNWTTFKDLSNGADMGVKAAWAAGAKGADIVVTVVDDGVDFNNPDLKPQEHTGYSMSYDANSPNSAHPAAATTQDMNDHGTSVAGIIAAQANTIGVSGIAPQAKLVGHRIMGMSSESISTYSETKILTDNISQVSNHSYGPHDNGALHAQSQADYDRIEALVTKGNQGKGHVMVFAAGNGSAYIPRKYEPSEINSKYASNDFLWDVSKDLGDYAGLDMSQQNPYIISVSGFDANDKTVTYAEAGPGTLVAGATADSQPYPTIGYITQTPLVPSNPSKQPAAGITTTGRANVKYPVSDSHRKGTTDYPDSYSFSFNGTSAAAPMVTGVVALMQSANPDLTWRDVRWILAQTARKIQLGENLTNQATGNPSTGVYEKAIWSTSGNSKFGRFSHHLGYGAADAGAAVTMAKNGYSLLPSMKTCELTLSGDQAYVGAKVCPSTIEFVQVKYQVAAGTNINNVSFTMNLAGDTGKTIHLLAPSTCRISNCSVSGTTTVKGGTVGFMGDTLGKQNAQGFNFSRSTNNITIKEVIVFGH